MIVPNRAVQFKPNGISARRNRREVLRRLRAGACRLAMRRREQGSVERGGKRCLATHQGRPCDLHALAPALGHEQEPLGAQGESPGLAVDVDLPLERVGEPGDGSVLLGSLKGRQTRCVNIPIEVPESSGSLVIYSLAHRKQIASTSWRVTFADEGAR